MSTTTTTRHETAARFLAALVGGAAGGELIELRYRLADGRRMGQLFEAPHRVRGLATRAIALGRRTDVYVGCAPRTRRHGGRDAVDRAFVLWADCDGDDAVSALERFEPQPSIVIASGTGSNCHAHWALTEPLARDELERANRRLAHALGADPASADAARILRVPSTFSHKHKPPTPVEALRLDTDRRLAARDIVGALPDPPAPRPTPQARATRRGDDPLLEIAPDVYVSRLLGVEVPRHRKVPCPFHTDRHPSLHVYDTPGRGWYCYGRCRRGGTIYDLAAPLYGYTARGEDFLKLRGELRCLFGLEAGAMSHGRDSHSFAYVECDIPPGMTIAEWRAQRAADRPAVTRQRPIAAARKRLRGAVDWIRDAGTRALAGPRIARVRVPGSRHRVPRPAAPSSRGEAA